MTFRVYDSRGRANGHGIEQELRNLGRSIENLGARAPLEIARGLNDGGNQVRTIVRHAVQEQMGVTKYAVVVKAIKSTPADEQHPRYEIWSSRGGLPIKDFVAIATPHGITAHVWGVDVAFQRSFVTSGRGLMLARLGPARMPIRALFGPAPYKELVKGETVKAWERAVPLLVEPLILKRLIPFMP